jgi:TolB-like protein/uncharacterized protein (DUF1330 family)
VLPLDNLTGDPNQEYFVDGMTETLIADLSKIGTLRVISRTSAMRYKETDKSLPEIARELGVEAVIEGSILREADRVRVSAQLIHAESDRHLWADSYERDFDSVLALQSELAQAIAREIQAQLTPQEADRFAARKEVDARAYDAYLNGRFHYYKLTRADLDISLRYFESALERDPDFALAWVGVASVWGGRQQMGFAPPTEAIPKSLAAISKALELDDSLAEAHSMLAAFRTWGEWDWEKAEPEFRRAIELDPNLAEYLSRSGNITTIEGEGLDTTLIALLEFPSMEALQAFADDPAYARYREARQAGSISRFHVIDDTDVAGSIPYLSKN